MSRCRAAVNFCQVQRKVASAEHSDVLIWTVSPFLLGSSCLSDNMQVMAEHSFPLSLAQRMGTAGSCSGCPPFRSFPTTMVKMQSPDSMMQVMAGQQRAAAVAGSRLAAQADRCRAALHAVGKAGWCSGGQAAHPCHHCQHQAQAARAAGGAIRHHQLGPQQPSQQHTVRHQPVPKPQPCTVRY